MENDEAPAVIAPNVPVVEVVEEEEVATEEVVEEIGKETEGIAEDVKWLKDQQLKLESSQHESNQCLNRIQTTLENMRLEQRNQTERLSRLTELAPSIPSISPRDQTEQSPNFPVANPEDVEESPVERIAPRRKYRKI